MEGTLRQLAQKEQDMLENDTYQLLGRYPITEVFRKEHVGRTKGASTVLGVRVALGWLKVDKERHHVDIEAIKEKVTKTVTSALQDKLDFQEKEAEALKAIVAHIQRTESPTCLGFSCAYEKVCHLEDSILEFIEWTREKIALVS